MVLDYLETFLYPALESPNPPLCLNPIHALKKSKVPLFCLHPPPLLQFVETRSWDSDFHAGTELTTKSSPAWCLTRGNPPAFLMMG